MFSFFKFFGKDPKDQIKIHLCCNNQSFYVNTSENSSIIELLSDLLPTSSYNEFATTIVYESKRQVLNQEEMLMSINELRRKYLNLTRLFLVPNKDLKMYFLKIKRMFDHNFPYIIVFKNEASYTYFQMMNSVIKDLFGAEIAKFEAVGIPQYDDHKSIEENFRNIKAKEMYFQIECNKSIDKNQKIVFKLQNIKKEKKLEVYKDQIHTIFMAKRLVSERWNSHVCNIMFHDLGEIKDLLNNNIILVNFSRVVKIKIDDNFELMCINSNDTYNSFMIRMRSNRILFDTSLNGQVLASNDEIDHILRENMLTILEKYPKFKLITQICVEFNDFYSSRPFNRAFYLPKNVNKLYIENEYRKFLLYEGDTPFIFANGEILDGNKQYNVFDLKDLGFISPYSEFKISLVFGEKGYKEQEMKVHCDESMENVFRAYIEQYQIPFTLILQKNVSFYFILGNQKQLLTANDTILDAIFRNNCSLEYLYHTKICIQCDMPIKLLYSDQISHVFYFKSNLKISALRDSIKLRFGFDPYCDFDLRNEEEGQVLLDQMNLDSVFSKEVDPFVEKTCHQIRIIPSNHKSYCYINYMIQLEQQQCPQYSSIKSLKLSFKNVPTLELIKFNIEKCALKDESKEVKLMFQKNTLYDLKKEASFYIKTTKDFFEYQIFDKSFSNNNIQEKAIDIIIILSNARKTTTKRLPKDTKFVDLLESMKSELNIQNIAFRTDYEFNLQMELDKFEDNHIELVEMTRVSINVKPIIHSNQNEEIECFIDSNINEVKTIALDQMGIKKQHQDLAIFVGKTQLNDNEVIGLIRLKNYERFFMQFIRKTLAFNLPSGKVDYVAEYNDTMAIIKQKMSNEHFHNLPIMYIIFSNPKNNQTIGDSSAFRFIDSDIINVRIMEGNYPFIFNGRVQKISTSPLTTIDSVLSQIGKLVNINDISAYEIAGINPSIQYIFEYSTVYKPKQMVIVRKNSVKREYTFSYEKDDEKKQIKLTLSEDSTIGEAREIIAEELDIPSSDDITIFFAGKALSDIQTFTDIGIPPTAVISLFFRDISDLELLTISAFHSCIATRNNEDRLNEGLVSEDIE